VPEKLSLIRIPLDLVPTDTCLDYPLYLRIHDRWVLFRTRGDCLSEKRAASLAMKGVRMLYIPQAEWNQYVQNLESECCDENRNLDSRAQKIRRLLLVYAEEVERRKRLEKPHLGKFALLGEKLAGAIYASPALGRKILRRCDDPALYFLNHSLNVSVYCCEIAKKLSLGCSAAKHLTFGALVHNVGYLFLPQNLIYKPGKLSAEEWDLIHAHPEKGAQLLSSLDAPGEVILTTMDHHERVDGKGYPAGKHRGSLHLFPRICTIADVFDALTNTLPYQPAHTANEAIAKMVAMKGKFDNEILALMSHSS
jgi:HD-GYP domain-containing protein (c-di-GMP phosphodiesterase class II)